MSDEWKDNPTNGNPEPAGNAAGNSAAEGTSGVTPENTAGSSNPDTGSLNNDGSGTGSQGSTTSNNGAYNGGQTNYQQNNQQAYYQQRYGSAPHNAYEQNGQPYNNGQKYNQGNANGSQNSQNGGNGYGGAGNPRGYGYGPNYGQGYGGNGNFRGHGYGPNNGQNYNQGGNAFNGRPNGPQGYGPNNGQGYGPGANFGGPDQNRRGPKHGNGSRIGWSVLSGVIIGGVAALIFIVAAALTLPRMIDKAVDNAASQAADTIEENLKSDIQDLFSNPFGSSNGQLPDNGSDNDSGNAPDDGSDKNSDNDDSEDVQSGSDSSSSSLSENTAFLGLYGCDVSDAEGLEDGVDYPDGAYITQVISGSPADLAGLKEGMIITKIDGEDVTGFKQLQSIIRSHAPGDKVVLTVKKYSDGEFKESTHDATLTNLPVGSGNSYGLGNQ